MKETRQESSHYTITFIWSIPISRSLETETGAGSYQGLREQGMGSNCLMDTGFLLGWWKCFGFGQRQQLSNIVKVLSKQWISSVQSLSRVRLFATPWITAGQASLSITNSRSSLRLTSIESVMPSSHLIRCRPLLLLPPIPPRIRVFSNESTLRMRWPKYWSFSFSIIPSKGTQGWSPSEWTGWISL